MLVQLPDGYISRPVISWKYLRTGKRLVSHMVSTGKNTRPEGLKQVSFIPKNGYSFFKIKQALSGPATGLF